MRRLFLLLVLTVSALSASACLCFPSKATLDRSTASGSPVETIRVEQVPVQGHEVQVKLEQSGRRTKKVSGELLAVSRHYIWILHEGRTRKIHHSRIGKLEIVDMFDTEAAGLGLWTGLGTVSAISHSFIGILTGPIWLALGLSATGSAAASNDINVDLDHINALYQYARFPQGMPRKPSPAPMPVPVPETKPEPPPVPVVVSPPERVEPPEPEPPKDKGPRMSGGFVMEDVKMLWGMGTATKVRDPVLARKMADARARKQVALLIQQKLDLTSPLDLTLRHIEIADRWQVSGENAHYSIAVVELSKCGLTPDMAEKLWNRLVEEGLDEF
jgi:hypothetical protein